MYQYKDTTVYRWVDLRPNGQIDDDDNDDAGHDELRSTTKSAEDLVGGRSGKTVHTKIIDVPNR